MAANYSWSLLDHDHCSRKTGIVQLQATATALPYGSNFASAPGQVLLIWPADNKF
jgi:hypothetical protein